MVSVAAGGSMSVSRPHLRPRDAWARANRRKHSGGAKCTKHATLPGWSHVAL